MSDDNGLPIPDLTDALLGCDKNTCKVNKCDRSSSNSDDGSISPDFLTATGAPWPTIIIAMVGIGLLIYTSVGFGIPTDRRIFGIVMIILWTLLWCILLWILWKEGNWPAAWWMAVIGVAVLVLFFVVVIALNLGQQ